LRQRTVNIHGPLGYVTFHVIQAIGVGPVAVNRGRNKTSVVQRTTSNSTEITFTHHGIQANLATIFFFLFFDADGVIIPTIDFLLFYVVEIHVTDVGLSGIFPFSFGWQTVFRQENAIFHIDLETLLVFLFLFAEIRQRLFTLFDKVVLTCQISSGVEGIVIVCIGHNIVFDDAFTIQDGFIHTFSSPLSKFTRLLPIYTYYWVVLVRRVAEVILDERLVEGQLASPT